MANQLRGGFQPVGGNRVQARKYCVASGFSLQNSCVGIAPGDVVKRVSDGTVILAETTDTSILGVVRSVSYLGSDGKRIYGGYVPAGTTYTGDADVLNPNAIIVHVWDDLDTEYEAYMATASATVLTNFQLTGNSADITATSSTSVDTVYKRSLRGVLGTGQTGSANVEILEILRSPVQDYASAYLRLKVRFIENALTGV